MPSEAYRRAFWRPYACRSNGADDVTLLEKLVVVWYEGNVQLMEWAQEDGVESVGKWNKGGTKAFLRTGYVDVMKLVDATVVERWL